MTQKVQEIVGAGETILSATNELFGDPTPLHVKRLWVVYLLNGVRKEQSADENQMLDLGGRGSDTALLEMEVASRKGVPTLLGWSAGEVTVSTASGERRQIRYPGARSVPVEGPWVVRFPPKLGAPAQISLPHLISWTEHDQAGVRYFSGTATYETSFEAPRDVIAPDRALFLDLGRVKNFAEVRLNGTRLETLWKAPFRVEVTWLIRPGVNRLAVRVTNLWPNRLIGDEQLPEDVTWNGDTIKAWPDWMTQHRPRPATGRVAFTTWRFWHKDSPLLESGLLGPVTLAAVPTIPLPVR